MASFFNMMGDLHKGSLLFNTGCGTYFPFFVRPDDVYREVKTQARAAILQLIEKEREGEQVDRALLKNVLGIFIEVGMGGMECYTEDFEKQLLTDSAAHYKRKATAWIAVRALSPKPLQSTCDLTSAPHHATRRSAFVSRYWLACYTCLEQEVGVSGEYRSDHLHYSSLAVLQ